MFLKSNLWYNYYQGVNRIQPCLTPDQRKGALLMRHKNLSRLPIARLGGLLMVLLLLAACGTASTPATPTTETGSATDELPAVVAALSEEERQQTVIWDMSSGPVQELEQWNPLARNARREKGFHQAMIEPLFILNYESGAIEPWLATGMTTNATQDVWTMGLREGVTWSDGEAFDADDVVFTVQLMLDNPELELDFAAGFVELVERVEKVDDLTVQFTLTQPNPRFQLDYFSVKIWGSFAIVPEHIWRDKDPFTFKYYDPDKGWPVFTGPYLLESFDDTSYVYVRDDDWWGDSAGFKPLPHPQKMIWLRTDSPEERADLMGKHSLDYMSDIAPSSFQELTQRNPNVIAWFDGLPYAWVDPCSRLLSFNTMQAPWDAKEMRWAVSYAIDHEAIVEQVYQGTTFPSRHFFPAYPPLERYVGLLDDTGLYERYPILAHDPQQARERIAAQGWREGDDGFYTKDGETLQLEIYAHAASADMQGIGSTIAEQLQTVGISATMTPLVEDAWVEHKTLGDFEAMIDWDACGSVNEPWAAMDRYHARWVAPPGEPVSNYNNQVRWANEEYSTIVDEMAPLPLGDPRLDDLFVEAMEIWMDELPFIPITQARQLILADTTYWSGWPTARNSYIHPPAWWQSTHAIIHQLEPSQDAETGE